MISTGRVPNPAWLSSLPVLALAAMFAASVPMGAASAPPKGVHDLDLSIDVDSLEPRVTIREQQNRVEETYQVNNNVYMIKITPSSGAPYYLVDPDGDGRMEMRYRSGGMERNVPQWSLFSW